MDFPVLMKLSLNIQLLHIYLPPPSTDDTKSGHMTSVIVDNNLITTCSDGPAASLKGSPTVSPVMDASCAGDPLPPCLPVSISFLALSQAPPALLRNNESSTPQTVAKISTAVTARAPSNGSPWDSPMKRKTTPTTTGNTNTSTPGFTILRTH